MNAFDVYLKATFHGGFEFASVQFEYNCAVGKYMTLGKFGSA